MDYALEKGSEYAGLTSRHSAKMYDLSKTKAFEAWDAAAPTAKQAYATSEVPAALQPCLHLMHVPLRRRARQHWPSGHREALRTLIAGMAQG